MRICVLTPHRSRYGVKLLNLLRRNGVEVEQVLLFTDRWRQRLRWARSAARRVGWLGVAQYLAQRRKSPFAHQGFEWRGAPLDHDYRRLARRVDLAREPRDPATIGALGAAAPDVCLLAGTGIIPPAVLEIPRWATLNAHPGVLPAYRGFDPEWWALWEGRFEDVGCTLHIVDRGVDTGPILELVRYRWRGDESIPRLLWRLNETCLDLLAEACRQPWPDHLGRAVPQAEGRLHHLFPPWLRRQAERKLEQHRSAC
jgi:folate-dependent phosphoribosylglycinamide formyltransferase PurN